MSYARRASATLLLLSTLLTCSVVSAKQRPQISDADRDEINRRCAKLLDENAALEKVVDAQNASIENLKRQLQIAQALVANGDEMAAAAAKMVELYKAQIADMQAIVAELKAQITENRAEIKDLRAKVDAGRFAWIKGALVGGGVVAAVAAILVLAGNGGN